jgi:regulator of replication initiation timing
VDVVPEPWRVIAARPAADPIAVSPPLTKQELDQQTRLAMLRQWLDKSNRRRKETVRQLRKAKKALGPLIGDTARLQAERDQLKAQLAIATQQVEALTKAQVKNATDVLNYQQAIGALMDRVFDVGHRAGMAEHAGNEFALGQCREELAALIREGHLLMERCFICGDIKNLREWHFQGNMVLGINPGDGRGLGIPGDDRSHALCEVCHCKVMSGVTTV